MNIPENNPSPERERYEEEIGELLEDFYNEVIGEYEIVQSILHNNDQVYKDLLLESILKQIDTFTVILRDGYPDENIEIDREAFRKQKESFINLYEKVSKILL